MTIQLYLDKIREALTTKQYDEYKYVFNEYIDFLKGLISDNPKNVKAVCQLAISYTETREPYEKSIKIMEDILLKYEKELPIEEKIELLNNLGYFYAEELYDIKKAKKIFEDLIKIQPTIPAPYNKLAMFYDEEDNLEDACSLFRKATHYSNEYKYKYNLAICLYKFGNIKESIELLKDISSDWKNDVLSAKAYYHYGMIEALRGKLDVGLEVANDFSSVPEYEIGYNQLADLYYLCKDYEKCIYMYDKDDLYESSDWLSIYFYSLYNINDIILLNKKYISVIERKQNLIDDEIQNPDEDLTKEESQDYIEELQKEISDIKLVYNDIMYNNKIPEVTFEPYYSYFCYYIDCPRHSY